MEREETNVRNEAQARMEDSDQKLFDLVPPIYHCSRLKLEEADKVLRQACMGTYIAILRDARGRLLRTEYLGNLEIVQQAKKESQGDQRDAEDAEDLSEHRKFLPRIWGQSLLRVWFTSTRTRLLTRTCTPIHSAWRAGWLAWATASLMLQRE